MADSSGVSKVHSTKGNKSVEDIAKKHHLDTDAANWSTADWKALTSPERNEVNNIAQTGWAQEPVDADTGVDGDSGSDTASNSPDDSTNSSSSTSSGQ